ncbi:hypothetical protein ACRAQ7_10290 [Erythrobacter sp. W53]|uniref:hypothetical protein n=1 Tax=Erythrobacter sp. W53 TaxID=3425947 RepID=UPI003D769B70
MAYSDEDLNSAVTAGVISEEAAGALRDHVAKLRHMPKSDEENFRLINSFNDIFVAIGVVIMLIAAGSIGSAIAELIAPAENSFGFWNSGTEPTAAEVAAWEAARELQDALKPMLAGLFVAAVSWPLAEFFTRKRRMALPSIILLLAFVGGIFAAVFGAGAALAGTSGNSIGGFIASASGLVAAVAAWVHWKRFMVPITVAAGAGAIAVTVVALLAATYSALSGANPDNVVLALVFAAGIAIFTLAMRWDMSDRERTTRRSDVAFWLHLLAAPMIAHPVFSSQGVIDGGQNVAPSSAFIVIAIYVLFGAIAVAIDRRALLVSALAYVLAALALLFERFGAVELTFALTALVIGSALLSLSAFWSPIRRSLVDKLPSGLSAQLPPTEQLQAVPEAA